MSRNPLNSPGNYIGSDATSPRGSITNSGRPSIPGITVSQYSSSYASSPAGTHSKASSYGSPFYGTASGTCNTSHASSYGSSMGSGICSCVNCPGTSCTCSKASRRSSSSTTSKTSVQSNVCPCGCMNSFQEAKFCEPKARYQPASRERYCGDPLPEIFPSRFARLKLCPPGWIKFCGKILCFLAYTQEPIPESNDESTRTRLVVIRYYLDNDTIEVVEPKTANSGYKQGRLISRGKIPLPAPADKHFYTLDHFNVGCNVDLYSRVFHIYGVADNTRYFLNKQGYYVPQTECTPLDVLAEKERSIENDKSEPECSKEQVADSKRRQKRIEEMLERPHQNRTLLKFNAVWDDEFEDCGYNYRKFNIYYNTLDHTVEIVEIHDPASVLECLPSFLCRGKVHKDPENQESDIYMPQDFKIGCFINILGIPFLITDADDFTKHYQAKHFNYCNQVPIDVDAERRKKLGIDLQKEVDKACGIVGEPEDRCKGCFYYEDENQVNQYNGECPEEGEKIEEKEEPTEEQQQPEENEDPTCIPNPNLIFYQMEGVLAFYSRFYEPKRSVDTCRRFIIRFYLEDYTIKVNELPHPNTGIDPGTLISRQRIPIPDPEDKKDNEVPVPVPEPSAGENDEEDDDKKPKKPGKFYGPKHFYIGSIIDILGDKFDLLDTDESSLSLMEKYSQWFPQSNICAILIKIIYTERDGPVKTADVIRFFSATDCNKSGTIKADEFRKLLIEYSKGRLNEHELKTLIRTYRIMDNGTEFNMELLRSAIHTELLRNKYDGLDRIYLERIEYTFRQYDPCRTSNIDRDTARSILLGARLPVPKELLDMLFENFPASDDCNRINYCELLEFLNWESPSNCFILQAPMPMPELIKLMERKPPASTSCVNYRAFLEQICPNFHCALSEICCDEEVPGVEACLYPCPDEEEDSNSCYRDPCSITLKEREYANLCSVSPENLYGSGFKLPKQFELPDPSCFEPPCHPDPDQETECDYASKYTHACPGCEPRDSYLTSQECDYAAMAQVCPEDLYGSGFCLPENFVVPNLNQICNQQSQYYQCNYNEPSGCGSSYQSQQGYGNYNCPEPIQFCARPQGNACSAEEPITYQAQLQQPQSYDCNSNY